MIGAVISAKFVMRANTTGTIAGGMDVNPYITVAGTGVTTTAGMVIITRTMQTFTMNSAMPKVIFITARDITGSGQTTLGGRLRLGTRCRHLREQLHETRIRIFGNGVGKGLHFDVLVV